jgi:hypothetical protein
MVSHIGTSPTKAHESARKHPFFNIYNSYDFISPYTVHYGTYIPVRMVLRTKIYSLVEREAEQWLLKEKILRVSNIKPVWVSPLL